MTGLLSFAALYGRSTKDDITQTTKKMQSTIQRRIQVVEGSCINLMFEYASSPIPSQEPNRFTETLLMKSCFVSCTKAIVS